MTTTPTQYVPIDEVAETFSVKPSTIRTWVRNGTIPKDCFLKINKTYRFDLERIVGLFHASEEAEKEAKALEDGEQSGQLELDFGEPEDPPEEPYNPENHFDFKEIDDDF